MTEPNDSNDDADVDQVDDEQDTTAPAGDQQGDEGEADWKSKFEAQQRVNRNLERKMKRSYQDALQKAREQAAAESDKKEPDFEEIRRQARDEVAAESLRERVLDKIEAKARKFVDSEDAAAVLLRRSNVDDFIDDGKVDVAAITDALDELAETKPHLVAKTTTSGGFDSARGKAYGKGQLDRADLSTMTPAQIEKARKDGRLDRLMGKNT